MPLLPGGSGKVPVVHVVVRSRTGGSRLRRCV